MSPLDYVGLLKGLDIFSKASLAISVFLALCKAVQLPFRILLVYSLYADSLQISLDGKFVFCSSASSNSENPQKFAK